MKSTGLGTKCKNCGALGSRTFCPDCGQKVHDGRLGLAWLKQELKEYFHLSSRFLQTLQGMVVEPGSTLAAYFGGKRKSFQGPVSYLLVGVIFYLTFAKYVGEPNRLESGTFRLFDQWIIVLLIVGALVLGHGLAARQKLTFAETTVCYCYMNGTAFLLLPLIVSFQLAAPSFIQRIPSAYRFFLVVDLPFHLVGSYIAFNFCKALGISNNKFILACIATFLYAVLIGFGKQSLLNSAPFLSN